MHTNRWIRVACLGLALAAGAPQAARATTSGPLPAVAASYRGTTVRLGQGWGAAHACTTDGVTTRCYRSEAEMDAAERPLAGTRALVSGCSSSLRLYRSKSYGGDVLQLTSRSIVLNLSNYGFNNDTSSYKVGACSASLYDTTTGGSSYPGATGAGVNAPSMSSGWDNRIGSAYIR